MIVYQRAGIVAEQCARHYPCATAHQRRCARRRLKVARSPRCERYPLARSTLRSAFTGERTEGEAWACVLFPHFTDWLGTNCECGRTRTLPLGW